MDAKRRISKKPREECQLLQVIRIAVRHHDARSLGAGEWVADLKVVLASPHLSNMSPGGSAVDDVRIVHPLRSLMRQNGRIVRRGNEEATHIKVERRVSLERQWSRRIDGVITAGTAVAEVGWIANRHAAVVNHEHGKCAGVNSLQFC